MLRSSLAILLLIAVPGCQSRPETGTNPLDEAWAIAEEGAFEPATDVRIEPVAEFGGHQYAHEVAGLVLLLFETGLAELSGVVPHYDRHGPPPGVDRWLTGGSNHWTARFSFAYERDSLQIVLRLCPQGRACKGATATGPRESPEGAITELLVWSAGQMNAPVPGGMVESWSQPLSKDRYAVLMLGRSAASWYGLIDPVDPDQRGKPGRDPVTRAMLIDPSMALSHYVLGRRALNLGQSDAAFSSFERAREAAPDRFLFEAAPAAAASAGERWALARKLWDDLDARWPQDSRFALPRMRAYFEDDMAAEADQLLRRLPAIYDREPDVARLRVFVAEKLGPGPDFEQLVADWEDAAAYDPEPVRRHIAIRLRDGRFEEAFELLEKLEARGAATEARQMMVALGAGIGRFDEAAKQAAALGDARLAERMRIRAALDSEPDEVPDALLRLPDLDARLLSAKLLARKDPEAALARTRRVLREDRFLAEAIALEVSLLEKMDRFDEAVEARVRLQFADPAFGSGPRTVAGATVAGSQSQDSLSE